MTLGASVLLLDNKSMVGKTSFTTKNDNFNIPVDAGAVQTGRDEMLGPISDVEEDSIVLEHTIHLWRKF